MVTKQLKINLGSRPNSVYVCFKTPYVNDVAADDK